MASSVPTMSVAPPNSRQKRLPRRRVAEHRVEAHQQVDAGLHHGGRMQVGRHWRRRLHGIRQPEVERELGRFGEGAAQDKQQHHGIERAVANDRTGRQQRRQIDDPGNGGDHQKPGKHRQPAQPRHDKRLKCCAARGLSRMIEADQQEGGDRGHLPEHEEHQEGVGDDQPQHRAHEHQHERQEAALMRVAFQVAARIEHDQRPDSRDQQGEGQRQAVEVPGETHTEARDPIIAAGHWPPIARPVRGSRRSE